MFSISIFGGDWDSGSGSEVKLMFTKGSFHGSLVIYSGDFSIYNKSSLHNESSSSFALNVSGLADEILSVFILGKWWSELASELL